MARGLKQLWLRRISTGLLQSRSPQALRLSTKIGAFVVGLFAALLAFHYGQRGFLPLDHSIVFELGNLLRCGRRPGIDFVAPAGLSTGLMQAAFFGAFGVHWLSYLLHAALLNVIATLACYLALLPRYSTLSVPLVLAAATAVVAVPPTGTPYPDLGSFVFSALALVAADAASRRPRHTVPWCLASGAIWSVAFLAKQIPSAFALPLVCVLALRGAGERQQRVVRGLAVLAGALVGLAALLLALGMPAREFERDYVEAALRVGLGRMESFVTPTSSHIWSVVRPAWSVPVALALAIGVASFGSRMVRRQSSGASATLGWRADRVVGIGLLAASLLYAALTFRSAWTSLGWYPMAMGFLICAKRDAATENGHPSLRRRWRFERWARPASVVCLAAWAAWFNFHVNEPRIASLLELRGRLAAEAAPSGLEWLDPKTASFTATDAESLRKVLRFLADHDGPFFLLGDSTILYGLSGRCSASPVPWFHPNLTVPWEIARKEATTEFQIELIRALERSDVRFVLVENNGTQMGVGPESLPLVSSWVAERVQARSSVGSFQVFELRAGTYGRASSPDARRSRR